VQRLESRILVSPTDLTKHMACRHVTALDLGVIEGVLRSPAVDDDQLDLIFALGVAHEKNYLESLRARALSIIEVPTTEGSTGRQEAEGATALAMRSGVDVIYQAAFSDGYWAGQADFLLRVEVPSQLGSWSYEVADTKLARRLKVPALLQMAFYADQLGKLQGAEPRRLFVVTGDGRSHTWRLVDVASLARRARRRLEEAIEDRPPTEPVPVTYCGQCRWLSLCAAQWKRVDDLSLVAFMRSDHRHTLIGAGISTMALLGGSVPEDLPRAIGTSSRERLVAQARQQLDERETGIPSFNLLAPEVARGLLRLPPPNDGDLYLDFEGDPFAEGGVGREYLAGIGDRLGEFVSIWAHDPTQERRLTEQLVDLLLAQWHRYPEMHVYHYAPYETTALKRLTARYGVREAELDQLLRGQRFIDLYAVVRQGMRISKPSYSIKKMEAFYWGKVRSQNEDVADAMSSVIEYERWLVEQDQASLDRIEAYNRDDVRSTHDLHRWLEERRTELEEQYEPLPRPDEVPPEPGKPLSPDEMAEIDLSQRLKDNGQELMANLVQWHRREARPAWWEVYRLGDLDDDELVDDSTAIGQLSEPVTIGSVKRSSLYEYTFPAQDTRVRVGDQALGVDDHRSIGSVVEIDPVVGRLVVKRGSQAVVVRGVGPSAPVADGVLRRAVSAVGEAALLGRETLGQALLERTVPAGTQIQPGELPAEAVVRVGRALWGSVLAVQGPPGSGKTTVGAELIRSLLDQGKKVGVTATSHSVIGNLLAAVGRSGLQKCDPEHHCGSALIDQTADDGFVADSLADGSARLVGGTAWLWARPDLEGSVDVLVVDEAGQFSLANAVAVSGSARALVLLGDPQQLAQPSRAVHPDGAGASVLEHLLDGHETIPADRGIFLDESWRMHPSITTFVSELAYDGRLRAGPGRERQLVTSAGPLSGDGLRLVPVEHVGMSAACPPEARRIAELWSALQGSMFRDHNGYERSMGANDVLVVAPYNNQVGLIRDLLPPGARVGTVDKFQGKEAAVVLYSMTSSTVEDAPRGVNFLYDLHRLNVAISRARAIATVVMSPRLLDAAVRSPDQLHRVNALCRFAESALWVNAESL